jgi:hypothetical protein
MRKSTIDVLMLTLALSLVPFGAPTAKAGVIGSHDYAQHAARGERIERIQGFLAREVVRDRLIAFGANPADVEGRLSALTDAELAQLEARIATMPAGGDVLAVIGVVFIVILILELVGVTNVFSKI